MRIGNSRFLILGAVLLLLLSLFPSVVTAAAESVEGLPVVSMQIQGNQAVSTQLIRAQLRVGEGKPFLRSDVQKDIERLFSLGYFSDVKADVSEKDNGVAVTYVVTERKIIREVLVLGNRKVKEADIRPAISVRKGETYVPKTFEKDIAAIREIYRKKGYPGASVTVSYREISPTEVEVVYEISEGEKARVGEVIIEKNMALSAGAIRKVMKLKSRILWFGSLFDEDIYKADLEQIKNLYADHGYMDARVVDAKVEFYAEGTRARLTIIVEEGPQYFIESVQVEGNVAFEGKKLLKLTKSEPRSYYNRSQLEQDALNIQNFYSDQGYILASVKPRLAIDRNAKTIAVTHQVNERELVYVDRIDIRGNVKTKDTVIRRELTVLPGERFDGGGIRRSRQKLLNTQYYKDVLIDTEPSSRETQAPAKAPEAAEPQTPAPAQAPKPGDEQKPSSPESQPAGQGAEAQKETPRAGEQLSEATYQQKYRNLIFKVEEQKTGTFNFGAGYSSNDALIGQIQVTQNNFDLFNPPTFTGAGQKFDVIARPGTLLSEYRLSLTEPYFLNYPFAAGFDLFFTDREFEDYDQSAAGAGVRFGKRITDFTSVGVGYGLTQYDISNVEDDAPDIIKEEEGTRTKSSVTLSLTNDTRDSYIDPTTGHRYTATLEFAGGPLGAQTDIVKLIGESRWYRPLGEKYVLMARLESGIVQEYGNTDLVPLFDRFFAGGTNSVRGYEYRMVGPRENDDPIGGKALAVGTLELSYPLVDIIRLYSFFDFGQVWREIGDFGQGKINTAVGVGIGIRTPIGPVRVDFGYPLNPDEDQGHGQVHFTTGLSF